MSAPERFAKLFERDGRQVLVTKDTDDKGNPAMTVSFLSNVAGHKVHLKIGFKNGSAPKAWELLDRAFAKIDEQAAFELRDGAPGVNL